MLSRVRLSAQGVPEFHFFQGRNKGRKKRDAGRMQYVARSRKKGFVTSSSENSFSRSDGFWSAGDKEGIHQSTSVIGEKCFTWYINVYGGSCLDTPKSCKERKSWPESVYRSSKKRENFRPVHTTCFLHLQYEKETLILSSLGRKISWGIEEKSSNQARRNRSKDTKRSFWWTTDAMKKKKQKAFFSWQCSAVFFFLVRYQGRS